MGKEDKWERERESILLCGSGNATWVERKKKKREKKKKGENPRNDGRNREGLFRRHTSDGRLCWEGGVEKGVSFPFSMCASHFFFQSPSNIENGWVRNTSSYSSAILSGKGGTPTQLLLLSLAFFFWLVCVCVHVHTHIRSCSSFPFVQCLQYSTNSGCATLPRSHWKGRWRVIAAEGKR